MPAHRTADTYVLGAGRLGVALALALRDKGRLRGIWTRQQMTADQVQSTWDLPCRSGALPKDLHVSTCVICCVPDDAIAELVSRVDPALPKEGSIWLHCSGAMPVSEAFAAFMQAGADVATGLFHPLLSVRDPLHAQQALQGATFALAGDQRAIDFANRLATELFAGTVVTIEASEQARYHLAAVIASNYSLVLWTIAQDILVSLGLDAARANDGIAKLVRSTLDNATVVGLPDALTGPWVRGDVDTMERHLQVLKDALPQFRGLYEQGFEACLGLAESHPGLIDSATRKKLNEMLLKMTNESR